MNIETAINAGAKILKDKYIRTANLDAEILMSKAINKNSARRYRRHKRYFIKSTLF